jgi:hypothetical protein
LMMDPKSGTPASLTMKEQAVDGWNTIRPTCP